MDIAVVAPSGVPFVRGGAENLWWGLVESLNARAGVSAELIKVPSPERNIEEIIHSYQDFARLDLLHFDQVITTKYPAWMVSHPNHVVYMQHKLRGLYDTYPRHLPVAIPAQRKFPQALEPLYGLLAEPPDSRTALPEIFYYLLEFLAWRGRAPEDWYAFPGAFSRAIVHMLDSVALGSPGIRRYCAIAETVAQRADYFPPKADVEVFYHPTSLKGLHEGGQQYFFTASRLDKPKRIDLVIKAWIAAKVKQPLYIAGTGPAEAELRQLAQGHEGIHFLGYVTDSQLADYYADALAVIFVPDQEDYGLITIEAMLSGKPVITVDDAGGVTEIVRDGENGWMTTPNSKALAAALRACADEPAAAGARGKVGKAWAETVSWEGLHEFLITGLRRKLVVINTFSVYPPRSGGQLRIYHLYRWLARELQVVLITPVPASHPRETVQVAPGFQEIRIPKTRQYEQKEYQLSQQLGVSAGDVAALLYHADMPEWAEAIRAEAADADWVVLSHPYGHAAMASVYAGDFIYEAHNMEFDLKRDMFAAQRPTEVYAQALATVEQAERACVTASTHWTACTEADRERLGQHYQAATDTGAVIFNGVDIAGIPFVSPAQRLAAKKPGGRLSALFLGSLHLPNIQAVEYILSIAEQCRQVDFKVAGSVCHALEGKGILPANVQAFGVVDDNLKLKLLAECELSLNPMLGGSGSNLKILEAAASGQLIVSTPFGGRGGILEAGRDYVSKELEEIPAFLASLTLSGLVGYAGMAESARQQVAVRADWRVLAGSLRQVLAEGGGLM